MPDRVKVALVGVRRGVQVRISGNAPDRRRGHNIGGRNEGPGKPGPSLLHSEFELYVRKC